MFQVTADDQMRRGHLHANNGNGPRALACFKRAFQQYSKTLGPDDPKAAEAFFKTKKTFTQLRQQRVDDSHLEAAHIITQPNPSKAEPPSDPPQPVDIRVQSARQMTETDTAAFQQGNFDSAYKAFSEALILRKSALGEDAPKTASSHRALGCTLLHLRHYDEALSHLKNAETITPNAIDVLLYLGYTHYRLEQYGEAANAFAGALTSCSRIIDPLERANCYQWSGRSLYYDGLYPQAITHFKTALAFYAKVQTSLDPSIQINAQFRLGRAYHKNRNAQETVDAMNEVLRLISKTPSSGFMQIKREAHLMISQYEEQVYEERLNQSAELASAVADSLKMLNSLNW